MSPKLFSNIRRTDDRPPMYGESPFGYLNLSACSKAQDIRNFLEDAFYQYPRSEKTELKTRIQLEDIVQSKSAIFELILHEILLKMGCQITVHPELENSEKKPDFLVKTKNGVQFYLEAVLVCDYNNYKSSLEEEKNKLFDQINEKFSEVQYANLWISIITPSSKSFSKKALYNDIKSKLDILKKNNTTHINWKWKNNKGDWSIELQLWKRTSNSKRFISCIYPYTASKIDVSKTVRRAFKKKSTKYGDLKYPYALAINIDALYLENTDEMNALFGKEEFIFTKEGVEFVGHQKNGAWYGPKGPRNTRVCGAWLFDNLTSWRLNKRHMLYLNPFSETSLSQNFYSLLPHARLIDEKMEWKEGRHVFEILGLDWKWIKA